jgi:hypothetical protein
MLIKLGVDNLSFRVSDVRPRYTPFTILIKLIKKIAQEIILERHLGRFYH